MTEKAPASYAESVAFFALYDALTGLPNEVLLHERLGQAISLARRQKKHVALLSLDLNYFKHQQTTNHLATGTGLQAIGPFLANCVRASDTVCHLGNNQFVILLIDIERPEAMMQVADKVKTAFIESVSADDAVPDIPMNMTISIYPDDGDDADTLLQHAERALPPIKLAKPEADVQAHEKSSDPLREADLRQAIANDEFRLHYQPQFDLTSCSVIGVEAFLRWESPTEGLLYPHQFMSLARKSGIILPLGRWVLKETCQQINAWKAFGMSPLPIAVNVSGEEFSHPDFVNAVAGLIADAILDQGEIELEISATVFMADINRSLQTLHELKAIGVKLAIDCFGIGMSSLRYLKDLPFDTIKVDRAFLFNIDSNPKDVVFLRSLIGFGKSLQRRTIIMGVENVQQLAFLQTHQCDGAQGFQLGHPLPADDFAMLLATKRCLQPKPQLH